LFCNIIGKESEEDFSSPLASLLFAWKINRSFFRRAEERERERERETEREREKERERRERE
jgi:hypothetical protein